MPQSIRKHPLIELAITLVIPALILSELVARMRHVLIQPHAP